MLGEILLVEPQCDPVGYWRDPGNADLNRLGAGCASLREGDGQAAKPGPRDSHGAHCFLPM